MSHHRKRADQLNLGDTVIIAENHLATVCCNWEDRTGRPFREIGLRNNETNIVAEMSVPNSLVFDVLELN